MVALRADMDALPILEETDIDFKSKNEGVMHACGHDVHSACLFGAASILQETKDQMEWHGKTHLSTRRRKIPRRCQHLIKEGILENPKTDAIIGQHVMPWIEQAHLAFAKVYTWQVPMKFISA